MSQHDSIPGPANGSSGIIACTCGATFENPEELDDHFMEIFIPDDGLAVDGTQHLEV